LRRGGEWATVRLLTMRLTRSFLALAAVVSLTAGIACKATFVDDVTYRCSRDSDCAGDGFVCITRPTGAQVCCKPSGPEVCDKVDNDCDGLADNTGKSEVCNGEDDDCNGLTDEIFNLQTDVQNCGTCGNACPSTDDCRAGKCVRRLEALCFDRFDNDNDGTADCDDDDCELQVCGTGCICKSLKETENLCGDGQDNDADSLVDCVDPDCLGLSCRQGCTCVADGGVSETNCMDGVDNDGDNAKDCLDPDCVGQYCTPPDIYFQCTATLLCKCNGGVQVAEVGSVLCRDAVDNDCDGEKDCEESTCDTQSCAADGGMDCQCAGLKKAERNCANLDDDDGDGKTDCADEADCTAGSACLRADGGTGSCTASKLCD